MGKSRSRGLFSGKSDARDEKQRKPQAVVVSEAQIRLKTQPAQQQQPSKLDSLSRSKLKDKAKQKSENNRSLRKMKKRDVVKKMLQRFPKESKKKSGGGGASFAASYNVSAAMSSAIDHDDDSATHSEDEDEASIESVVKQPYASRKLMIRKMQGLIAKGAHPEANSEYDSWSDLEENFAREYEPIPLDIHIDTWRKMSKVEIIETVRSKRMKKDFEYMSRSEILARIELMQRNAKQLSSKFGVDDLLKRHHQQHVEVEVHHRQVEKDDDIISTVSSFTRDAPQYYSRSEILKSYGMESSELKAASAHDLSNNNANNSNNNNKARPRRKPHDSWSSRASSIMENPESIYVSREEVLRKLRQPQPRQVEDNATQTTIDKQAVAKRHGSWSSHASSILARMEGSPRGGRGDREPLYMSRAELLERLVDLAYDVLSGQSGSSSYGSSDDDGVETESNASTVKNVVLTKKTDLSLTAQRPQQQQQQADGSSGVKAAEARTREMAHAARTNNYRGERIRENKAPAEETGNNLLGGLKKMNLRLASNLGLIGSEKKSQQQQQPEQRTQPQASQKGSSAAAAAAAAASKRAKEEESELMQGEVSTVDEDEEETSYSSELMFDSDCDTCSCSSCESVDSECSCCMMEQGCSSQSHSSASTLKSRGKGRDKRNTSVSVVNRNREEDNSSRHSGQSVAKSNSAHSAVSPSNPDLVPSRVRQPSKHVMEMPKEAQTAHVADKSPPLSDAATAAATAAKKRETAGFEGSWRDGEFEQMYEAVDAREIHRQKNARALKKHLREMSADWDATINDLNTLRRGKVIKDLKRYIKQNIDLQNSEPEEIDRKVAVLLREALDSNFEALSNLNIGQMYVPMDELNGGGGVSSRHSKASRDTTDYDTFGSIDSLIFEPKVASQRAIKEAQEEIELQFKYLNNEECGEDSTEDYTSQAKLRSPKASKKPTVKGPGKTTFAERLNLFQNLGRAPSSDAKAPLQKPTGRKITFLDIVGKNSNGAGRKAVDYDARAKDNSLESVDESHQTSVSLCPDCHNPFESSLTVTLDCSVCDCCTQCALDDDQSHDHEDEDEDDHGHDRDHEAEMPQNHSAFATGWNFSKSQPHERSEADEPTSSSETAQNQNKPTVINLSRQLKETFGAPSESFRLHAAPVHQQQAVVTSFPVNTGFKEKISDILAQQQQQLGRGSEAPSHVEENNDFLAEYATRQDLLASGVVSEIDTTAVLLRGGETVRLTEDMFRGEFKGMLKRYGVAEDASSTIIGKGVLKKQGSEMGDSGIASPPNAPPSLITAAMKEDQSDSGLDEAGERRTPSVVPPGGMRKRDTMIRELKSKLKQKFHSENSPDTSLTELPAAQHTSSSETLAPGTVESRRATMGPELSRMLSNKLSRQLTLTGGIPVPPPAPSPAASQQTLNVQTATSTTTFRSIYEKRLRQSSEAPSDYESTVYDPSLPDELKRSVPAGIMFRGPRPFTPPVDLKRMAQFVEKKEAAHSSALLAEETSVGHVDKIQEQLMQIQDPAERREVLYGPGGLFGPKGPFSTPTVRYPHGLEVAKAPLSGPGKKSVHFGLQQKASLALSMASEAEDRSIKSHYVTNTVVELKSAAPLLMSVPSSSASSVGHAAAAQPKATASRMETYRAEWAEQECVSSRPTKPLVPEDLERWREEKARRMLAWINSSPLNGYWGSETPWWKAKQRASIKWLLSKAYSQSTPEELREPFYKDSNDADHLKPHIVHALANAELYCMALSNLYADPNFHNLSHWGIIQVLAKKGIFVAEPTDCSLTESALIQTNPVKMSAHMAMTEALMALYIKETLPVSRVCDAVRRLDRSLASASAASSPTSAASPTDQEEALLLWLAKCCQALTKKAEEELKMQQQEDFCAPTLPTSFSDVSEMMDGVGLCAAISLYRPSALPWTELAVGTQPPSMTDSMYNIQLVARFCAGSANSAWHLTVEDVVYMHTSIKQNVIAFMADLFNQLETTAKQRADELRSLSLLKS